MGGLAAGPPCPPVLVAPRGTRGAPRDFAISGEAGGQQAHRVTGRDVAGDEHARIDAAPTRMPLLRHPRGVAVRERGPNVDAGRRVARHLEQHLPTQLEPAAGDDVVPLEAFDGEIFAERAGDEWMSLGLKGVDPLQREQADGAVGTTVMLEVAMRVALEARACDLGRGHRVLRHSTGRDTDLNDSTRHRVTSLPMPCTSARS